MAEKEYIEQEEIFSQVLRAGRRTYFFDVRATKAEDFYLTITESKKFTHDDGSFHYKKHKIYLYKEDFQEFREMLGKATDYIIEQKGEEVISERHQKDFKKPSDDVVVAETSIEAEIAPTEEAPSTDSFTDVKFEDI